MNWKAVVALCTGLMLVIVVGAGGLYMYLTRDASGQNDKFEALKELRDTGVITQQDYDSRLQAILASTTAASAAAVPGMAAPGTPAAPAASNGSSSTANVIKAAMTGTRKVEVTDPQYQTTAYTMEIPGDWKFAGDIVRAPGCHSAGASLRYTAQSPDGLTANIFLPGVTWSWTTSESRQKIAEQMHCPGIDIDTAASFLVNIAVPNIRPKSKIVEVLPLLPEGQASLKEQLAKMEEQGAALARQYNAKPQKLTLDGARVHIQYERDGHQVEEMLVAVINCNEITMPALYNQAAYQQRTCSSRGTVILRAPKGHLDEEIAQSGKRVKPELNQAWQSRLLADQQAAFQKFQADNNRQFQSFMQQNERDHQAMLARGREMDAQTRARTDAALAADRQKQAAIDASAHATALYSLDRQEFRNPSTGQVIEASNQYNHQWISSDGSTLIQTDSHSFDPNGQVYPVSQSWTELIPKN